MNNIYITLKELVSDFLKILGYNDFIIIPNGRDSKILTIHWDESSSEFCEFEEKFIKRFPSNSPTVYYKNRKLTFFKSKLDNKYICNVQPIQKDSKYKNIYFYQRTSDITRDY